MLSSFKNNLVTYECVPPFTPGHAYNTMAILADIGEILLALNFLFDIAGILLAFRGVSSLKSSRAVRSGTIVSECPKVKCALVYL